MSQAPKASHQPRVKQMALPSKKKGKLESNSPPDSCVWTVDSYMIGDPRIPTENRFEIRQMQIQHSLSKHPKDRKMHPLFRRRSSNR